MLQELDARQLHEREAEGFELLAGGGRAAAAQRRDGRGIPSERFYRWAKTSFFCHNLLIVLFLVLQAAGKGKGTGGQGEDIQSIFLWKMISSNTHHKLTFLFKC